MKTTLLIHCNDDVGIISAVTNFIHIDGGNVVYLDQHVDKDAGVFFMRLEAEFAKAVDLEALKSDFESAIANTFAMHWQVFIGGAKPRMALFVSKYNHCLYDLLSRYRSGELEVTIPFIISNHDDLRYVAEQFEIPFHHIPYTREIKDEGESAQLELLLGHRIDFIVLARYMQIVGKNVIDRFTNRIINIHHSFLPAFAGAKPYHAAYKRGVKIIGATSHYVTEALDEGPIIEQDVTAVSHAHSIGDFIGKGRDLEKIVLARAVKLHIERKTMVYNNKTVIFT
ncbi:MAG: formyltetrahydrofolate deformylase [Flavobacteriaceae bacterium]|nr:formyltetrahydrofolate deformylase [Flavobacteriaceae bacterium]